MGSSESGAGAESGERKQILFVDDDSNLLDGLQDALRAYRHRWKMTFVSSGADALAVLQAQPHDVIVSDLRMPVMDGARLLELARDLCPGAVRIVLSGQAEVDVVVRAAAVAHRLIAKPCVAADLANVIERSCALRDMSTRVEFVRRAMGVSALPSVPRIYAELTDVLISPTAGAADVARVVERDIAMAAKVLQLANSAYFGRRSPVSNISSAVAYLGVEVLRALVLAAETFQEFIVDPPIPGFDVEALHRHCTSVARVAGALIGQHAAQDGVFAAGLLHEVGLLVLASQNREDLAETLALAREQQHHISEIEQARYGVTHAELGAHLLALWGLPHPVIEAVARHHDDRWPDLQWGTVPALYVANALVEELEAERLPNPLCPLKLDHDYLDRVGVATSLNRWRELAAGLVGAGPR